MEIKHKQEIGVLKQNIQYLTDEKKQVIHYLRHVVLLRGLPIQKSSPTISIAICAL